MVLTSGYVFLIFQKYSIKVEFIFLLFKNGKIKMIMIKNKKIALGVLGAIVRYISRHHFAREAARHSFDSIAKVLEVSRTV